MKNYIKVCNPLLKDELAKAGFTYISIELKSIYVYEATEELQKALETIMQKKQFSNSASFVCDSKLRF